MPNRGKGGRGRGGRGGFGNRRGGGGGGDNRGQRWGTARQDIPKTNPRFEEYYNDLGIVPEEEKEAFWNTFRQDLPNSFRFTGSKGHALTVQKRLVDHYIPEITKVNYDGQPVEPPKAIQWYPDQLAYAMTTPKNVIRKFPSFAAFQKFLVSENSVGNITRQEIVSMIPPLVMGVKPGMTVLDLCAAPGSKSSQLIEMVHGGEEARIRRVQERLAKEEGKELTPAGAEVNAEEDQAAEEKDYEDDGRATGLLIANDVDYRRAQMLVHQCKRLNSPNLIVTNHDATMFPSIKVPSESGNKYLKFDRILADVPCSGDGTCRKNPEIWKDWSPSKGLGLHIVQTRILVRALQMLKVGGRVVYSTCSMNPIENEAVVAAAIDRCGGNDKVKLLDQSHALPGMQRRPGLTTWKVMDKSSKWWSSWKDVEEYGKKEEGTMRLVETMFPPEESIAPPLENCIRVYPHLQDTGGFFIAVLEKQTEIKARPEKTDALTDRPKKGSSATTGVMDVVNEIEDKTANGAAPEAMEHIQALDEILPPQADPDNDMDQGNAPPAARQNAENTTTVEVSSRKREAAEIGDASASTKRAKIREEPNEPAEIGAEERTVHFPPPPAAQLEATAHHHDDTSTSTPATAAADTPSTTNPNQLHKKKPGQQFEEPFKFLDPAHTELDDITSFYRLSSRFPRTRFMVRNATGQPVKSIYYTSALARDLLVENEGKGLRFVHCGVKMFVKQDVQNSPNACKWRIQSEGLPIIEAWVGEERVVRLRKRETLQYLLREMFPKMLAANVGPMAEISERVREMNMGCCVLRVEPSADAAAKDGFEERLVLPLWRGIGSLNLMLPKEERKAMLLRLYNDDSELVDNSKGNLQGGRDGRKGAEGPKSEKRDKQDSERRKAEDEEVVDLTAEDHDADAVGGAEEKGDFHAPNDADILAKLENDLDKQPNGDAPDEEEEDGGVPLAMETEDKVLQKEDAIKGEAQNLEDKTTEVAPGVVDEEDVFNKTV